MTGEDRQIMIAVGRAYEASKRLDCQITLLRNPRDFLGVDDLASARNCAWMRRYPYRGHCSRTASMRASTHDLQRPSPSRRLGLVVERTARPSNELEYPRYGEASGPLTMEEFATDGRAAISLPILAQFASHH